MALQYKKNKINIYVTKEMISQKKKIKLEYISQQLSISYFFVLLFPEY